MNFKLHCFDGVMATDESKMGLWRKTPYLTVDEAMNLIFGVLPGTYEFVRAHESKMPSESVPIYRKLVHDIDEFKLCVNYHGRKITDMSVLTLIKGVTEKNKSLYPFWWENYKILTEDLKEWLQRNGFSSTFFEIKPANIPDFMNSDLTMHSYKLAAAVKAWEHFYIHGLTHPKKSPKQNILAWLRENAESLNLDSEQSMEEIAKIVNWKPDGGAPKS